MKQTAILVTTSAVSVLLMMIHVADDVARGLDRWGPQNIFGLLIWGVWMYGAVELSGRRSGYIIVLLGSIMGVGIPVLHMQGKRIADEVVRSPGGILYAWTLYALGTASLLSLVHSLQGLWRLRRGKA